MKNYTLSLSADAVMNIRATLDTPSEPTAENYRFDLSYNGTDVSNECEVQFYDSTKKEWVRLAGTLADILLLNIIRAEPMFTGAHYVYFTIDTPAPELEPSSLIDVTPNKETPHGIGTAKEL